MNDKEIIHRCFEEVAQSGVDITPAVYEKFTEAMPQVNQHIDFMDNRMRGRMLDQIYKLLLEDIDSDYLKFETDMHRGYGADSALYRGILEAVKGCMRDSLGENWSKEYESAWDRSIDSLVEEIQRLEPEATPNT